MEVFLQYEESFLEETQAVTNCVSKFNYDKNQGDKRSALMDAKGSLRKAEGLLKQMEAHSRELDAASRSTMRSKLSQYKKTMLSLRGDIDRAESQGQRDMVMGGMSVRSLVRVCSVSRWAGGAPGPHERARAHVGAVGHMV
jgi:hypothetical protein